MKGFDPYDALAGKRVPRWFRSRARGRQVLIQLRKRVPLNLAPVLGIEPRLIAKALGCFITAEARLHAAEDDALPARPERVRGLVSLMDEAGGNCGAGSWGYEFDVQTRWAYYAAGTPNLIATVFVGRGLAEAGTAFAATDWSDRGHDAAAFVATELLRNCERGRTFFAYTPDNPRLVHNANLLGAGFVACMGVLSRTPRWPSLALEAAAATIAAQRADGSWPYGEGQDLGWSDSFHTAYNLDGLLLLWLATDDGAVRAALAKGVAHWTAGFFGPSGGPKYYPNRSLPYDIHCAATAVDVAARLATWGFPTGDLARRVAEWTRANLVDPHTGLTYFQRHRLFVDRRNFVRWGEAHWALAQASLALLASGRPASLERAVHEARRPPGSRPLKCGEEDPSVRLR